ncbi:Glycosyltransferase [Rhynchospora pubera]|uniref:Glycosyltransferase n=1 Tax=Rhynchospora pubera TaxID=906938 RepID=A0AAV8H249_9POAL|nr:Glycosyltransferase [Rhynchospora pubera]
MEASEADVSIVVVPLPTQGHLNQLLHLSVLLSSHALTVYYAAPAIHIHQARSRLEGWPASAIRSLRFHELPIPPYASPAPNPNSPLFFPSHLLPMFQAFKHVQPLLANFLRFLSGTSRRVVVISDLLVSFAATEAAALPKGLYARRIPCTCCTMSKQTGVRHNRNNCTKHHCLYWLDRQPPGSVLYVSFGTNSSISDDQIEQLAIGLLNSKQRFVWVLREADRGDFIAEGERGLQNKLPPGFMETIEDKGTIIGGWAPQLEILAHKATGAFMSHCGWNSCMESISMGVPILAWPMHSDQPWNAVLVCDYLKVGLIVRDWDHRREILPAAEIEKAIKEVMVYDKGQEIKRRASELGEAARRAASGGGSSNTELLSFINHIMRS